MLRRMPLSQNRFEIRETLSAVDGLRLKNLTALA